MLSAAAALLVLVMPTTSGNLRLSSSTYLCTGYTACQAAGYTHAGYRQASSTMYWRMFAGHNCTNYVAYRLIQNGMPDRRPWEGSGNAAYWGASMASITDQTPRVGAVAWYKSNVAPAGPAGHVAYVEQVLSPTEIIVSEDYWGGDFHWRRVTKNGSGWPSGFIHFNDVPVQQSTPPTVTGNPAVGAPLALSTGSWSPEPTGIAVRWLADGAAIPGATSGTYVPTPDVKGKTLTAEVTAERAGYSPGVAAITTAPVSPGTLQPLEQPQIEGTPEVGQTLTLTRTSWSPQPSRTSTQWYADGVALPGATGPSLVLNRSQIDRRITARVVASAKGYRKSRTAAAETPPVLAKPIQVTSPFRVVGRPRVGRDLTVQSGASRPSDASATYAWLRDGKRIGRAVNGTYTVRRADVGRVLAVQITLNRRHFRTTTETVTVSSPVTTVPSLRLRYESRRRAVAVNVRVRAPGVPSPTGALTVRIGGRTVAGELVNGSERLVVRGLRPGRSRVVVRYAGSETVESAVARSRVEVLRRLS